MPESQQETIEDLMALLCADTEICVRVILARTNDPAVWEETWQILRNVRRARAILGKEWKKSEKRRRRQ